MNNLNIDESKALNEVLTMLYRKLQLAKTCSAYYKGTNKKTINKLVLQINALYKVCGVNHSIEE